MRLRASEGGQFEERGGALIHFSLVFGASISGPRTHRRLSMTESFLNIMRLR